MDGPGLVLSLGKLAAGQKNTQGRFGAVQGHFDPVHKTIQTIINGISVAGHRLILREEPQTPACFLYAF